MTDRTVRVVDDQIEISFPFDWTLVAEVKEIAGRKWDSLRKVWTVPFTPWHCDKVVERLMALGFSIDKVILKSADRKAPPPKTKYPEGLYPFQRLAVDFAYNASGRCIIADDMGLGKTIEALAFVKLFCGRALVVCPANVLWKWAGECERWVPGRSVCVVETGKQEIGSEDVVIMSYAIMVAHYDDLIGKGFDVAIFDEAHYLKSYKSQRTRIARALLKDAMPKVLFLSGTPFLNRPTELYSLLNMIDPKGFNNFYSYAKRYCGAQFIDGHWYFDDSKVTNVDELTDRLKRVMIRRTKSEAMPDLPELTRTSVPVEIPNKAEYKTAVKDIGVWLKKQKKSTLNKEHVLARLNVLRQICGLGKVDAAVDLAESVLQNGNQVVLFAHHKSVVKKLQAAFKCRVELIVGDTSPKERTKIWQQFLEDSHKTLDKSAIRVIIMSAAGAEGIDLYSASDIIFVEREWTPAKEEQAESRLHRNGQKNAVNAWYLVAKHTVDEKLDLTVRTKRQTIGSVISRDEVLEAVLEDL